MQLLKEMVMYKNKSPSQNIKKMQLSFIII